MVATRSSNGSGSGTPESGYVVSSTGILIPQSHATVSTSRSSRRSPFVWKVPFALSLAIAVMALAPKETFVQTAESQNFFTTFVQALLKPITSDWQEAAIEEAPYDPETDIALLPTSSSSRSSAGSQKSSAQRSSGSSSSRSSPASSQQPTDDSGILAFGHGDYDSGTAGEEPITTGSPSRRTLTESIPDRTPREYLPPAPVVNPAPVAAQQAQLAQPARATTTAVNAAQLAQPAAQELRDRIVYLQNIINHEYIDNIGTQTITENIMNTVQNTLATNNIAVHIGDGAGNNIVTITPNAEADGNLTVSGSAVSNILQQTVVVPPEQSSSSSAPDIYTQSSAASSTQPSDGGTASSVTSSAASEPASGSVSSAASAG